MRNITVILSVAALLLSSCSNKLVGHKFIAVEPWKEWQIELTLNKDSTFTIIDRFGCNRFNYSGWWYCLKDSVLVYIVLKDTTKSEYIESRDMYQFYDKESKKLHVVRANEYFPVIRSDTIKILSQRQVGFRGLIFNRKRLLQSNNLDKERTKMLEDFYVSKIGREGFIRAFGSGKGIKAARKNISDCKIIPVFFVNLGKSE